MDILSLLEEVQNESLILRHPLAEEDISIGYAYAVGVGLVAVAEGELNEAVKKSVEKLAIGLNLPEPQICKLVEALLAPEKAVVKSVVETVNQLSWQYLFLLDAQKMALNNGEVSAKSQQALEAFAAMFKMSPEQKKVWQRLAEDALSNDFARSVSAFALVYGDDLDRIYRNAVYYLPDQGKDALEQIEGELNAAPEVMEAELERLGTRPLSRKYREDSNGERIYEGSLYTAAALRVLGLMMPWKQDDSEGETWDNDRVQIQQNHLSSIDTLEKKRQALASALDSMYLSS